MALKDQGHLSFKSRGEDMLLHVIFLDTMPQQKKQLCHVYKKAEIGARLCYQNRR
jgi:hypothetical protein